MLATFIVGFVLLTTGAWIAGLILLAIAGAVSWQDMKVR